MKILLGLLITCGIFALAIGMSLLIVKHPVAGVLLIGGIAFAVIFWGIYTALD